MINTRELKLMLGTAAATLAIATGVAVTTTPASARKMEQPHMKTALGHLELAKRDLDKATPDKGGHRVKALELVAQAMVEVKAGMEFDKTH